MHRRIESTEIVTDGRVLGEIEQLRKTLQLAQRTEKFNSQGLVDETPRLERRLVELAQQAAEGAVTVTVKALLAEEFDDIARRHPPSVEQLDRYRIQAKAVGWAEMPEYNDRTMAPDLLAACMVEPEWSLGWWRELSRGTQNQVWNFALRVQLGGADLPFYSAATASTNGGGDLLTMPANGASPPPKS